MRQLIRVPRRRLRLPLPTVASPELVLELGGAAVDSCDVTDIQLTSHFHA